MDDLFYFYYEPDAEFTESIAEGVIKRTVVKGNLIRYGNDEDGNNLLYEVTYKGNTEPYLLYKEDVKQRTKTRTLKGVK